LILRFRHRISQYWYQEIYIFLAILQPDCSVYNGRKRICRTAFMRISPSWRCLLGQAKRDHTFVDGLRNRCLHTYACAIGEHFDKSRGSRLVSRQRDRYQSMVRGAGIQHFPCLCCAPRKAEMSSGPVTSNCRGIGAEAHCLISSKLEFL
jgi:hypothetical protein